MPMYYGNQGYGDGGGGQQGGGQLGDWYGNYGGQGGQGGGRYGGGGMQQGYGGGQQGGGGQLMPWGGGSQGMAGDTQALQAAAGQNRTFSGQPGAASGDVGAAAQWQGKVAMPNVGQYAAFKNRQFYDPTALATMARGMPQGPPQDGGAGGGGPQGMAGDAMAMQAAAGQNRTFSGPQGPASADVGFGPNTPWASGNVAMPNAAQYGGFKNRQFFDPTALATMAQGMPRAPQQ